MQFTVFFFAMQDTAVVITFPLSLEILTFEEMRNCLFCVVQSTDVDAGILDGAFRYVGS
jgi:hypothetical protein